MKKIHLFEIISQINSSERSRIRFATVESAERDHWER